MSGKVALVTGVTGQDGSYTADLLLSEGWQVVGTTRDATTAAAARAAARGIALEPWDVRDSHRLAELVRRVGPAEIYNFSAHSTGVGMYDDPVGIGEVNGIAVTRLLEAIRAVDPTIRFCQASSSEMFGEPVEWPQTERTPCHPRSPYGAAKFYAHLMVGIYRQRYGLFACSAILFNHESPRRGLDFVTRKITHAAASIRLGRASEVELGNLDARRDWSFAGDAVRAMRLMLQADRPDDYVVASGETHSVRDVCALAFAQVGLDYRDHVRVNERDFRSNEARQLVGDPAKVVARLGWSPRVPFAEMIRMMVDADLARLGRADQALE